MAYQTHFTQSSTYLERKRHENFLKEQFLPNPIYERYLSVCLALSKGVVIEIVLCLICLLNHGFYQGCCN